MSFFEFPHTRTYNSDLGWLIKHVNSFDETIATLNAWIAENQPKLDDFETLYNMMISGNLPVGVQEGINKWMRLHALDIVGELVKMVWFGLNDDGYFVAYIPESWADIIFNTTGLDSQIAGYDYGHLVLSFKIGGQ
jgi:hypothetical protein